MPEISSILVSGETPRIASQSSAPERSPRKRSTRATSGFMPPGRLERLLGIGGDDAALDPALAAEQDLEPPLDDGVVVDDQHPQRRARPLRPLPHDAGDVARRQHQADPPAVALAPELEHPAALQRLVRGEPQSEARARAELGPPRPSLRTSSAKAPSTLVIAIRTSVGRACFSALRSASPSTETASGSSPSGPPPRPPTRRSAAATCTGARAAASSRSQRRPRRLGGRLQASGRARRGARRGPPRSPPRSASRRGR